MSNSLIEKQAAAAVRCVEPGVQLTETVINVRDVNTIVHQHQAEPGREAATEGEIMGFMAAKLSGTEYPGEVKRPEREVILDRAKAIASILLERYVLRRKPNV
jgi:hypothetical protein